MKIGKIGNLDEYIKANRKASRQEEISAYGHSINQHRVFKSKKTYTRKVKHKKDLDCVPN